MGNICCTKRDETKPYVSMKDMLKNIRCTCVSTCCLQGSRTETNGTLTPETIDIYMTINNAIEIATVDSNNS